MVKKESFILALISALLFIFPGAVRGQEATLYFSPAGGTYYQGNSFWLNIMVDTKGQAVNAIGAYFSYPEDKLEPLGVNTAGSVMTIWAEKNAAGGKVEISGGLPTPGFSGIQKIASVGFKVKVSSGSANLKFNADSAVLTDADNKNILNLSTSGQGNYKFSAQVTPPSPEPTTPLTIISEVSAASTTQKEATIYWKTDQAADSLIEYGLTADYGFSVSDEKLAKEHSLTITDLLPGIAYYFKIKSQAEGKEAATENLIFYTLGYQVEIQALSSADKTPLAEAVIISPGPPEIVKTANQEGKVIFENLPLGIQLISVKYKDASLSYPIEVLDEEGLQSFKVELEIPAAKGNIYLILIILLIVSLTAALIWTILETRFSKSR
jgi:hypothetical protein